MQYVAALKLKERYRVQTVWKDVRCSVHTAEEQRPQDGMRHSSNISQNLYSTSFTTVAGAGIKEVIVAVFSMKKMMKRLKAEGREHLVEPQFKNLMYELDGHKASARCWRRVVYGQPVMYCCGHLVNELDCVSRFEWEPYDENS